jgi:2-amino-4-hydroxy-6-hydroxymethyldihydropteridine diphosphokinase
LISDEIVLQYERILRRQMETKPVTVYLGLGSNMGDRQKNLDKALDLLSQRLQVEKVSSVYETEPIGNVNQPRFLNMVCQAFTRLAPVELLAVAKGIELKLGRAPGKSNAPRPIDIDILFYGDLVIETPELVIPHPRLTERAFVLIPLAEIAPDLVHPVSSQTVKELMKAVTEVQGVFKWEND